MAWRGNRKNLDQDGGNGGPAGGVAGSDGGSSGSDGGDSSGGNDGGNTWGDLFGADLGTGNGGDGGTGGSDPDDGYYYRDGKPVYNADGTQRKKRSRRGTGSTATARKSAGKQKVPVDSLSRFLAFGHMAVANMVRVPELTLSDNEATMMARPMSEILGMYGVEIDPKAMAWMELIGAASYVYGPRIVIVRERMKGEKAKRDAAAKAKADANAAKEPPGTLTTRAGVTVHPDLSTTDFTDLDATFGIDANGNAKFQ